MYSRNLNCHTLRSCRFSLSIAPYGSSLSYVKKHHPCFALNAIRFILCLSFLWQNWNKSLSTFPPYFTLLISFHIFLVFFFVKGPSHYALCSCRWWFYTFDYLRHLSLDLFSCITEMNKKELYTILTCLLQIKKITVVFSI